MRIGVVGGGQLGLMIGLAGVPLGMEFRFWDPSPDAPAAAVGELVCGAYDNEDALDLFSDDLDVITYEFENIPASTLNLLEGRAPVRPGRQALEVSQDRVFEKSFFASLGVTIGEWQDITSLAGLTAAVADMGPCIVKTRRFGYDGKGQRRVETEADCKAAWSVLGNDPLIVEKLVTFQRELSLVGVRGQSGDIKTWPLVENVHHNGILRKTTAPAVGVPVQMQKQAESMLRSVMESLDYVGVLTIEFFEIEGELLANEMAPRVHNSGHWSIEGSVTSQFENHVRAIAGLPLGETAVRYPSVMINCLGSMPVLADVLNLEGVHPHDYRKSARDGRKVGHITVCDELQRGDKGIRERVAAVEQLIEKGQKPVING